jgi:hypothetical protein
LNAFDQAARKAKNRGGSFTDDGIQMDVTTQAFDDGARQKHTQSHPMAGRFGGEKRLADSIDDARRDAAAPIADLELQLSIVGPDPEDNFAVIR